MIVDRNVKQVIVIRRDLGMRRGKEIAQGSHASLAWLSNRMKKRRWLPRWWRAGKLTDAEHVWLTHGFAKITCQVSSEEDLRAVMARAEKAGVQVHAITDEGLTEFGGVPTLTAVAVGPDWSDRVDLATGSLKLY